MPGHTIVKGLPCIPGKLLVKQSSCSSRTAAGHKPYGLHQQAFGGGAGVRQRRCRLALRASTSSFGLDTEEIKEGAESKLQDVPKGLKDIK